jgi:putative FmdB family regulatory protein
MPTYEYQCDACDHNFDEFQSFTDKPLKKCPKCGKSKLRRVFGTGAAIIFKGSGFYQTDYRSESYKSAAKAEESAAKPSGGDTAKTDSKSGDTAGAAGKSGKSDTSTGTNAKSSAKSPKSGS